MSGAILVFAEHKDGKLRNVSLEILTAARQLAQGKQVIAVLINHDAAESLQQLGNFGADQILVIIHDRLNHYTPGSYKQAFLQIIEHLKPDGILFGHTAIGKDLAPRLAARLDRGLVSDCTGVYLEGEDIVWVRPVYAGKAFEKRKFTEQKWFATIRPNNIKPEQAGKTPDIVHFDVEINDMASVVKEIVRNTVSGIDLSEANIIVSGGRGVRSAEGFKPLQELAGVLGGAVGASRGACDADYCDYALQIGQTGKVVTPDLYIACGISGAIQHIAGMSQSKIIVAINKDPEAPIFQIADYGIVGDLFEVVPLLTEKIKKALQNV